MKIRIDDKQTLEINLSGEDNPLTKQETTLRELDIFIEWLSNIIRNLKKISTNITDNKPKIPRKVPRNYVKIDYSSEEWDKIEKEYFLDKDQNRRLELAKRLGRQTVGGLYWAMNHRKHIKNDSNI